MPRTAQISAPVSPETRDLLDRYVRSTGIKKGYLIETALRHHLQAIQELPSDVIVPPRLVLSRRSGDELAELLASPGRPTRALRKLMRGDGD
jgi:uncharacterized protein (DUF1778 family)